MVLLALLVLCPGPVLGITYRESNCDEISRDSTNLVLIGMQRNNLVLISRSFWVFELERTIFNGYDFEFYFHKRQSGMPIESRWPGTNGTAFQQVRPLIQSGWLWAEYLFMFRYRSAQGHQALFGMDVSNYTLLPEINSEFKPELLKELEQLVCVSSLVPDRDQLWLIRYTKDGHVQMGQYGSLQWRYLCQHPGSGGPNLTLSTDKCDPPEMLKQRIVHGFQSFRQLFLLTAHHVVYVSTLLLDPSSVDFGRSYRFSRKPLHRLLVCQPSVIEWIRHHGLEVALLAAILVGLIGSSVYYIYRSSLRPIKEKMPSVRVTLAR